MSKIIAVFDPIAEQISKARAAVAAATFDYEDPKQNKAARSLVAKVRRLKAPLNAAHKQAKADALAVCNALDERRREYLAEIEAIIEVHAAPIRAIEEREQLEQERIEREERERLEAQRAEQEAKEAELRRREEEIARREREERIAQEAAQRAKEEAAREAERRIAEERERARMEIEAAKIKAQKEQEAREEAMREAERKTELIRRRAEEEKALEAEEKARREADEAHRAEVIAETSACIGEILCDTEKAGIIADAIANGLIRHVEMVF